jgi:hypothetical protein
MVQRESKRLRHRFYQRRVQHLRQSNSRQWWRGIKQFIGQSKSEQSGSLPLTSLANQLCNGNINILANDINNAFKHVSDDLLPLSLDIIPTLDTSEIDDEFKITPYAVERKLSLVKSFKSPGPDNIPNWLLHDFSHLLANPISTIFNSSIREGLVPSAWKLANVIPVPKTHPPMSLHSDFRPISLTSTLSKILESFIGQWILNRVRDHLDARQYGALRGKSTTHYLVDILHHWHAALDSSNSVRALFVDFTKAFDHVDHSLVIKKLIQLGIPDLLIRWVCSFLYNRQQRVKIGNILSNWVTLKGAMPQGSWLGPLTFLILIDDLEPSCLTHKYIDDVTLTEIIAKGQNSQMDSFFTELLDWSISNLMNLNASKTKDMIFGSLSDDPPPQISFQGNLIERVHTFKLLGIKIDDNLKWNSHINYISSKASSRIHFLKLLKRSGLASDELVHFYTTVIRPILEYACPVWHTSLTGEQSNTLEAVQRRALRIIFGKGFCIGLHNQAGLDSLASRRESLSFKFFEQILQPSSCLHYLLPPTRDPELISRLRHPRLYEPPKTRTQRFKNSFLVYSLYRYQ